MEISASSPFEQGVVINIDKPLGWTSTDVVRKIKPMLGRAGFPKIKIGHAGTLDPLATGVLLVCVGRATKRVDELQAQAKEYIATVELGATTPSFDLEHPVDQRYPYEHITEQMIRQVLDSYIGPQSQMPPLYSAKRIDGRRAYDIARAGETVQLRLAEIEIYEIELLEYVAPRAVVRVVCSKGTYIRSLARDLGADLDSGGHLTGLRRTRSGEFFADQGISIQELERKLAPNETKI